jgi:predicted helicase
MKFGKNGKEKDQSSIIYNSKITLKGIPLRAYDYTINGKSAIAWIMKYQGVTTDPKSGIIHDANLWATETMNNPKYPFELLQRVITVSLETLDIVQNLPKLNIK